MTDVLWREGWLKPLSIESLPNDICSICKEEFEDLDFVAACEFCEIGLSHELCCNKHITSHHMNQLKEKINKHREKRLHSHQ
ncbi:hypothetical protein [Candidatus Nitrosocosmicus franklandus]|uniref:Uncharacterized protein n=1 Tax=Candidatus Nitrosocosmicus franklandianus TaxID=1798806 RepID=A0A484IBF7_9ARCH|nr:hypothetical protein [Candidatus Nitrosocosmicus franklandus]VFJ15103.1 conserved protein of unknown function [Candidatus Nitrosocosmicus franklandus]